MHGGAFFTTRDSSAIVIGHKATPKDVKDKLFPAFISGAACSVAPAMINSTFFFFQARRSAAFGGAVPLTL